MERLSRQKTTALQKSQYLRIGVAKVLTPLQSTPTRRGEKNKPNEKLPERVGVAMAINAA